MAQEEPAASFFAGRFANADTIRYVVEPGDVLIATLPKSIGGIAVDHYENLSVPARSWRRGRAFFWETDGVEDWPNTILFRGVSKEIDAGTLVIEVNSAHRLPRDRSLTVSALPASDRTPVASPGALSLFLDCESCDADYVRTEIDFVNYVRDPADADVHLLVTSESSGGGSQYTLAFMGRRAFAALGDTLAYASSDTDTADERRAGLVRVMRLGLARFVARLPIAPRFSLRLDPGSMRNRQNEVRDRWNFWVFRLASDGTFDAVESNNSLNVNGNASASRVTAGGKFRLSASGTYRRNSFDLEDETIVSTNRNGDLRTLLVKSLGSHWALGGFASVSTSSFKNTDLAVAISPALEYNVFPYSVSTRKELRLSYFLNLRAFEYEGLTVFGKRSDLLLHHELDLTLEFKQPWGSASASIKASNYLADFNRPRNMLDYYNAELYAYVEVRVVRGLSFYVWGSASRIRDQLFLPAKGATDIDILLRNRTLPTSYEVYSGAGLSFTFGSIYNNVVNSRFGS